MVAWLIPLLVSLAINIVAYLLAPKPKTAKPEAAKDMDNPVAEAGMPVPVVFGTMTVKGLNCLGFWDKAIRSYQMKA